MNFNFNEKSLLKNGGIFFMEDMITLSTNEVFILRYFYTPNSAGKVSYRVYRKEKNNLIRVDEEELNEEILRVLNEKSESINKKAQEYLAENKDKLEILAKYSIINQLEILNESFYRDISELDFWDKDINYAYFTRHRILNMEELWDYLTEGEDEEAELAIKSSIEYFINKDLDRIFTEQIIKLLDENGTFVPYAVFNNDTRLKIGEIKNVKLRKVRSFISNEIFYLPVNKKGGTLYLVDDNKCNEFLVIIDASIEKKKMEKIIARKIGSFTENIYYEILRSGFSNGHGRLNYLYVSKT